MKDFKILATTLFFAFTLASMAHADTKIDPRLKAFAKGNGEHSHARVIAILENKLEDESAPKKYKRAAVLSYLKRMVAANAQKVAHSLRDGNVSSQDAVIKRKFYVNNSIAVDVTPRGLLALAKIRPIVKIYFNAFMDKEPYQRRGGLSTQSDGPAMPYDFVEIGMDKLISQMPEVTGKGVLLGHCDTGVDGNHPALKGKIKSYYDAVHKKTTEPVDTAEHGSHTAGTMVGGNRTDNLIGMAPDAKLLSAGIMGTYDSMLQGMQHMLEDEGKELPRAVSNSWNCNGAPDVELFYRAIGAWESAGVLPVFSAGNAGPKPATITPPHEHPSAFAVASFGPGGKPSSFSSRGPGKFHGQETQKPDISAPGEAIYSSVPNGKYVKMNGTSMATPHVAGAVALILQVSPKLNPTQIRQVLLKSATPTNEDGSAGTAGQWNATFGFGKLNVFNAVKLAKGANDEAESFSSSVPFSRALSAAMEGLFITPDRLDARQILANAESEESFLNEINYPTSYDGDTWLSVDQLIQ